MTKEEKIKEAWGEYFAHLSDKTKQYILLNNGQVNLYLLPKEDRDILLEDNDIRKYDSDFICTKTDEGTKFMFRPKSLQGIEDNNGWVRIESEDDLPKTCDEFLVYNKEKEILIKSFIPRSVISSVWLKEITHYQKIFKPKPPLYLSYD